MTNITEREALKERLIQSRSDKDAKSRTLYFLGMQNCPTTAEGWVASDLASARARIEYEEAARAYDKAFREYVAGDSLP